MDMGFYIGIIVGPYMLKSLEGILILRPCIGPARSLWLGECNYVLLEQRYEYIYAYDYMVVADGS